MWYVLRGVKFSREGYKIRKNKCLKINIPKGKVNFLCQKSKLKKKSFWPIFDPQSMKFYNQSEAKVHCSRQRPNLTAEIIGFFPEKSPFSHIKLMTLVMTLLLLTFPCNSDCAIGWSL